MQEDPDELTLMAYLTGDCRPEERAAVEEWIARAPEARRAQIERLRKAWNPPPPPPFDAEERLRRRLRLDAVNADTALQIRLRRNSRTFGIAAIVAAAAAVILAVGLVAGHRLPAGAPTAVREIVTPRGQRAAFTLRDGTRVMLDADSRLREIAEREITLVGRAYFQVTHDGLRHFRVHTANGVVEDLGTEFVVTAFPEQQSTRVVVASGAVAVRAPSALAADPPLVTLDPGGMAWIDNSGLARVAHHVDLNAQLAWTEGRHVFRRAPVPEVLTELGRWYDVELKVTDAALLRRRLTVSFGDQALPDVLEVLSVSLGVETERNGRVISLVPLTPVPSSSRPSSSVEP